MEELSVEWINVVYDDSYSFEQQTFNQDLG